VLRLTRNRKSAVLGAWEWDFLWNRRPATPPSTDSEARVATDRAAGHQQIDRIGVGNLPTRR